MKCSYPNFKFFRFCVACSALVSSALFQSCAPKSEPTNYAQIHIISNPSGAEATLDGKYEGQTPLTIMKVVPGEHLIVLKKTDCREVRSTVTARPGERIAVDLALETLTGLVLIHSQPDGADIEINGASFGKTPLLLPQMHLGRYRLTISAPGFLPKTMELSVTDRTPIFMEARLISDSAHVSFNSSPTGAVVSIAGVSRGTTPFTVAEMPSGTHKISLTMKGYEPYSSELTLKPGDKRQFDVTLTPLPGRLTVVSSPERAQIYLNGNLKGEAPLSITNLPAGEYLVRAELRGYESAAITNSVVFGEESSVQFDLIKNSGSLLISTEPAGVRVHIDGEELGVTESAGQEPVSTQLLIDLVPQGSRKLQFTKQGYFNIDKNVDVTPGLMVVLHEKLRPRPIPFVPNVIIRTGPGPEHMFRGIIRDQFADGSIRLEIESGIFKTFRPSEIISREPIKIE